MLSISSFFSWGYNSFGFNPVTSLMVKYYEDIKGSYDLDKSHLASITNNGVWIKEEIGSNINFIKNQKTRFGNLLLDVSIYSFSNNILSQRIEENS